MVITAASPLIVEEDNVAMARTGSGCPVTAAQGPLHETYTRHTRGSEVGAESWCIAIIMCGSAMLVGGRHFGSCIVLLFTLAS